MSGARRLLLAGGIALAVWGMGYGLCTRFLPSTRRWNKLAHHWRLGLAGAERNSALSERAFRQYRQAKYVYDRQVDVHGHWIGLAMVLIVLGIGLDRLAFSERIKMLLSASALLGAFLFPLECCCRLWTGATDRAPSLSSDRRSSLSPLVLSHWGSHANPPVPRKKMHPC